MHDSPHHTGGALQIDTPCDRCPFGVLFGYRAARRGDVAVDSARRRVPCYFARGSYSNKYSEIILILCATVFDEHKTINKFWINK